MKKNFIASSRELIKCCETDRAARRSESSVSNTRAQNRPPASPLTIEAPIGVERDDWWQIEAREPSRGPGPRSRLINISARAPPPVTFSTSWTYRNSSSYYGMRPTDPNLLTRDVEERNPSHNGLTPPYITLITIGAATSETVRNSAVCGKFRVLGRDRCRARTTAATAAVAVLNGVANERICSQIESKL